jgi:excisionase family DNA binding protein
MTIDDYVPIIEAARLLGVSRTRVWAMVRDGRLVAWPDPLDRRQRLISRASIELLLRERGGDVTLPGSVGIVSDPGFRSSESEEYLQAERGREVR